MEAFEGIAFRHCILIECFDVALKVLLSRTRIAHNRLIDEDHWVYFFFINTLTLLINLVDAGLTAFKWSFGIPEWILHMISLFGGGPVTAILMVFGHHSSDEYYHKCFCVCCFIHILVVLGIAIRRSEIFS